MLYPRVILLVLLLVICVFTDISRRKIYDGVTFSFMGLGIALTISEMIEHPQAKFPLIMIALGMIGSAIIFVFPCFVFKWLGAGDFKLMLAIGALHGHPFTPEFIFNAIFLSSLVGAVMALVILIWENRLATGLKTSFGLLLKPKKAVEAQEGTTLTIPYGVAIAIGTLWALAQFMMGQAARGQGVPV